MAHKPDPDPFAVFLNATSYWKAASALVQGLKLKYPHNMPIFVVEAFALELHLKCLLRVRGKLLDATHEPRDLFLKLDTSDQNLVVAHAKRVQSDPDSIDVESVLTRSEGVFKKLRYQHEGHQWPLDANGVAGNTGFYEVIQSLRHIILVTNPQWIDAYRNALGYDDPDQAGHMPESLNFKTTLQIVPPSTGS